MEIDLNFPLFRIESRYDINGQILLLPINGNGTFVGNFSKLSIYQNCKLPILPNLELVY